MFTIFSILASSSFLDWRTRPQTVQSNINEALEGLARNECSTWGLHNGRDWPYSMVEINEFELIRSIINNAPHNQTDFWILEIGAGDCQWGKAFEIFALDKKEDLRDGIRVHIVSVGGENIPHVKQTQSFCTRYNFGCFKVEEFEAEFQAKNFHLQDSVDFIISHYCFRHLVDPIGTYIQAYNLLRPKTGIMLTDGFLIKTSDPNASSNDLLKLMLMNTGVPFVMHVPYGGGPNCLNHFLILKQDEKPLKIPLNYCAQPNDSDLLTFTWAGQEYTTHYIKTENWKTIKPEMLRRRTHYRGPMKLPIQNYYPATEEAEALFDFLWPLIELELKKRELPPKEDGVF
ncbi:MAG: hypothetical protein H6850_00955 [Alphaproteobacteria bacterium]|nr:MAG: hypothetical protein H6850_00955 [Alphaproteobacteria bacterium]